MKVAYLLISLLLSCTQDPYATSKWGSYSSKIGSSGSSGSSGGSSLPLTEVSSSDLPDRLQGVVDKYTRAGVTEFAGLLQAQENTYTSVIDALQTYHAELDAKLAAIGVESKTVAEWRAQWEEEGNDRLIDTWLKDKSDDERLYYHDRGKHDANRMRELGIGEFLEMDIWEESDFFLALVEKRNGVTTDILRLQRTMQQELSQKINNLGGSLDKLATEVATAKTKLANLQERINDLKRDVQHPWTEPSDPHLLKATSNITANLDRQINDTMYNFNSSTVSSTPDGVSVSGKAAFELGKVYTDGGFSIDITAKGNSGGVADVSLVLFNNDGYVDLSLPPDGNDDTSHRVHVSSDGQVSHGNFWRWGGSEKPRSAPSSRSALALKKMMERGNKINLGIKAKDSTISSIRLDWQGNEG